MSVAYLSIRPAARVICDRMAWATHGMIRSRSRRTLATEVAICKPSLDDSESDAEQSVP